MVSAAPLHGRSRLATSGDGPGAARAWVVMCFSLAVASCRCTPQERPLVTRDGLELETKVTADDKHLFVHYTVKNTEATTAYLLNLVDLPDAKGFTRVHKDNAYVYVDGSDVLVEKAIPAIPPGVRPYEPVTPYMTALRPGASFEETVELPLPLRDSRPYRGGPPGDEQVRVEAIRFSLGYFRAPEGTTDHPIAAGSETAVQFNTPPGTLPKAGQLATVSIIHSAKSGEKVTVTAIPPKL